MPLLSAWQICASVFKRHPNQREKDSASSAEWQFLYCFFILHQLRNDNFSIYCHSDLSRNLTPCSWMLLNNVALCSVWDASFIGMTKTPRECHSDPRRNPTTSSRILLKNAPKKTAQRSGWDASFIGMTICVWVFKRHPNQREKDSASSAERQFLRVFFYYSSSAEWHFLMLFFFGLTEIDSSLRIFNHFMFF